MLHDPRDLQPADEVLTSVIEQIAPQVHHIHGRIGYDHGPQVNDPRAPEWQQVYRGTHCHIELEVYWGVQGTFDFHVNTSAVRVLSVRGGLHEMVEHYLDSTACRRT